MFGRGENGVVMGGGEGERIAADEVGDGRGWIGGTSKQDLGEEWVWV
jgi:hypothetical protein